jgi:Flp pilus assembly protein TadB
VVGSVTALAVFLGAPAGLGVALIALGIRGRETRRASTRVSRRSLEGRTLRLAITIGAAVLVGAGTGWPVAALLAAAACWGIPQLFVESKAQAQIIARVEAVAGWAEMLRDTMAGAAGLEQAIAASAPVAPLPIRREVAALAARLERERLGPALRAFADDVADPTCDLVVAALLLAAEHQASRLGELLGTLATAARDQATMRLRVEAGRARTRTSVKVIVGVTLGLALFLAVLNHGYLAPYRSSEGQLVLLLVGGLFAAAFAWLARMTRPDQPSRFLRLPLVNEEARR